MSLKIILASTSPRRRLLLRQIGLTFEIIPPHCDEVVDHGVAPSKTVEQLALQKAEAVGPQIDNAYDDVLIIGADSIVVCGDEILGKPAGPDEAAAMLRKLSGRTHQVYTGVALIRSGSGDSADLKHAFHERTDVVFGELSDREISAYVDTGSSLDKAGAYGIQDDLGALFVSRIEGDYYNVVGFPLYRFYREVNKLMPEFVTPFRQYGPAGIASGKTG